MTKSDDLSRRQFLRHSAGLAGASLALGADRVGRGDALRVGLVGVGDRGRHLLGALLQMQRAGLSPAPRVVALADVDSRNLSRGLGIAESQDRRRLGEPVRGFGDHRRLLELPELDAVFISTPVHLHARHVVDALEADKHVYCEKPLAGELEDCRRIRAAAAAAEARGLVVQVGFQRRYSPRYRESLRFLHSGEAGRVVCVRAQWHTTGGATKGKSWLNRAAQSGDLVVEQASHQLDVFGWLFRSPPLRACGLGGSLEGEGGSALRDTLDHYGVALEYAGGGKVYLTHLNFALPDRRFVGIYELAFAERAGVDLAQGLVWTREGETRRLVEAAAKGTSPRSETELAVGGFLDSLQGGPRPAAHVEDAYTATLAAILCRKALREGRTVSWSEIEPPEGG